MVQIVSNQLFGDFWIHVVDGQNSRSSPVDFGPNIGRQIELTVTPRSLCLQITLVLCLINQVAATHALPSHIEAVRS